MTKISQYQILKIISIQKNKSGFEAKNRYQKVNDKKNK